MFYITCCPTPLDGKYLFKLSKWLTYLNFLATCDWICAVGQSRLDYLSTTIYFETLKFFTCCKILSTFAYFLRASHYLLTCPLHVRYLFKMSKWLTYVNCLATCETYYVIDQKVNHVYWIILVFLQLKWIFTCSSIPCSCAYLLDRI